MNKEKHNIFLIDGNSLCYRAYYAIPQLSTSKGVPTNAVYGMVSMLRKIIKDYEPSSVLVAFDLPGETVRHKKYENYKENRPPMPDDLASQMKTIKEVVKAYSMPIFEKQGYEADDVIATITHKAKEKGCDVTIVTGDKDALQLVDENVRVLSPHPFGDKLYDAPGVVEKFGVPPELMVDLMALMGDSSDNIPGVKGVGKVTAKNLICKYGSLDGVYENIDKVLPLSVRKKLEEGKGLAELSRDLVRLQTDVPLEVKNITERLARPDTKALKQIFKEMEFTKLLKEMEPGESVPVKITTIASEKELAKLARETEKAEIVSLRVDTDMCGFALSFSLGEVFYVDLEKDGHLVGKALEILKNVASSEKIIKTGHDLKRDMLLLVNKGIEIKMPFFDVMIADYLVDPSLTGYSLRDIATRRNIVFQEENGTTLEKGRVQEQLMEFAVPRDSIKVSGMCDAAMRLRSELEKELKERELYKLFFEVEMPLVKVLSDMEASGVGVDVAQLEADSNRIDSELKTISEEAYVLAGEMFNINSPKQIQEVLYGKLALPVGKKIKTGRSTDEDALKKLSCLHELPGKILEYRRLSKLKTSYYDSIIAFTSRADGMLHAKFNQAVTATGRLSSSEPNLQNIPIRTEVGREIRRAFRPCRKENVLVAADYSQVELRVLAHLSDDKRLSSAFREGRDVHIFTAAQIFGCEIDDVTEEMRGAAKTVNFGIIYGMGSFGLASALGISNEKAEEFIAAYFDRYRGVKDFISNTIEKTRKEGYVTTLFNRRRYLPEITSLNDKVRSFAERAAVNTAVQGTAADIIKMAMIKCWQNFSISATKMIIQVHDELVFDVPKKEAAEASGAIKRIMEGVVALSVPLEVNVESGPNWRDMEPVNF